MSKFIEKLVKHTPRFYKQWGNGKYAWVCRRDGFLSLSIMNMTDGVQQEIHILPKEIPLLMSALFAVLAKVLLAKTLAKERKETWV